MIKLQDILNEIKSKDILIMRSNYTDSNGPWHSNDWCFNINFKTKGCINKNGLGANGKGFGKEVILCTDGISNPFIGTHQYWRWSIIFRKNIYEIFLDDEIFDCHSKYKDKELNEFLDINLGKKDISLGELRDKFDVIVTQDNFPFGNYVLNIKPNEIIDILEGEGDIKIEDR